jgi:hypothetical protein
VSFEVRARDRTKAAAVPPTPEQSMAPRRDGGPDRRQICTCGRRRSGGRGSRHAGSAPARQRAALRLMRKLLKKQGFAPLPGHQARPDAGDFGEEPGRESRLPGSVRAKPNGRATRPLTLFCLRSNRVAATIVASRREAFRHPMKRSHLNSTRHFWRNR